MHARDRLQCLELLLKAGADVNDTSRCLYPALNAPAISLVFDRLADPSTYFRGDEDVLMYTGMVKLLLTYGKNFFPLRPQKLYEFRFFSDLILIFFLFMK